MERYIQKIVLPEKISPRQEYATRWPSAVPPALRASIARRGVLQPCVMTKEGKLLSGQRRAAAAVQSELKSLPVLELQEPLSPQDCFVTAVLLNWNQQWTEIDRVWIVNKAKREFEIKDEIILEEILPALGLEPQLRVLQEYETAGQLDPSLIECIAAGQIPFRGSAALAALSVSQQKFFAAQIAPRTALTTNQLLQICEWISDLLKQQKMEFPQLMEQAGLLKDAGKDKKANTDILMRKLRALKFPHLQQKEKQFESLSGRLRQGIPEISLEAPPYFEAEGLTLRARARDAEALKAILAKIQDHKELLNSLFDVLL